MPRQGIGPTLVAQQETNDDAERRMAEALGAITTERDFALSDLIDRHARENDLAREYLAEKHRRSTRMNKRPIGNPSPKAPAATSMTPAAASMCITARRR